MSSLRRWHWMLIGLLLGLAVGGWQVMVEQFFGEPSFSKGVGRSFDQRAFEQIVVVPDSAVQDWVYGPVTVHPPAPDGTTWVSGRYVSVRSALTVAADVPPPADDKTGDGKAPAPPARRAKALYFIAGPMPDPYTPAARPVLAPGTKPGTAGFTVRDYLAALAAQHPEAKIAVRYAWWDEPTTRAGLTGVVGLVIVGGFWPTILWTLCGMGYGPPPRPRKAEAAASPPVGQDEVAALLGKYGAAAGTPDPPKPAPPEPGVAVAPGERKHYEGVYYPVARPGKGKE